ncbi:hypothetical protein DFH06DRAFT_1085829 [Mycena polygramma]|nr:hypothetical protein DFH06DRAFT_1085829 [Mycena polygramma]
MLTENPRVVFAKRPGTGFPLPGEHVVYQKSHSIDLDAVPLHGGFLTKTLMLSPEPFMRERMRDPSVNSYSTHSPLGEPCVFSLSVASSHMLNRAADLSDHLYGMSPWQLYTVQPYIEDPQGAFPWSRYLSILGVPGLSAFCGFEGCADAKSGETIYVSAGASAVGVAVIQLAKAKGLKVIASAGADSKVDYMRSLGADVAFNYKTTPIADILKEHGPLDIYWDNVGGEAVELAIEYSRLHARLVMCGCISEYNLAPEKCYGVKASFPSFLSTSNLGQIFKKRMRIEGFLLPELVPEFGPRFYTEVPALLAQGKMTAKEDIMVGLENGPEALLAALQEGGNGAAGKVVILVATE